MDNLFAPWRIKYVQAPKNNKCIFCIALKEEKNFVYAESELAIGVMNIFPYNAGHVMIAPRRHVANIEELTVPELVEIGTMIQKSVKAIKKVMNPEGFNIGINLGAVAGAGVKDHLHIHLVPRWNGDTNFMPIIADTKVVGAAVEEVCEKIKKEMD